MRKVTKPWGYYKTLFQSGGLWVKEIYLAPGKRLSLQRHGEREEFWYYVEGDGRIRCGEREKEVGEYLGDNYLCCVTRGQVHRAEGGEKGLLFIEVAIGTPREDDIERIEDDYGRIAP